MYVTYISIKLYFKKERKGKKERERNTLSKDTVRVPCKKK